MKILLFIALPALLALACASVQKPASQPEPAAISSSQNIASEAGNAEPGASAGITPVEQAAKQSPEPKKHEQTGLTLWHVFDFVLSILLMPPLFLP